MEFHNCIYSKAVLGFRGGSDSKESVCNAGDLGLILLWEKSPGEGNGNHSSVLAWEIPWTEEPGRLQSMGSQQLDMTMTKPPPPPP